MSDAQCCPSPAPRTQGGLDLDTIGFCKNCGRDVARGREMREAARALTHNDRGLGRGKPLQFSVETKPVVSGYQGPVLIVTFLAGCTVSLPTLDLLALALDSRRMRVHYSESEFEHGPEYTESHLLITVELRP